MKIAININELTLKNKTGVKVYTREIVGALGKIDKENEYLLYANWFSKKELSSEASELSSFLESFKNFKLKTAKSRFPFWTYTKFPQELKKDKPDVLFMPIQSVPFFKKPKNIKIVVTVHDLAYLIFPEYFTAKDRFLLNFHTKRAVEMADKIIAPSEATKNDIIKFYGKTSPNPSHSAIVQGRLLSGGEDKIKVIYHGVAGRKELKKELSSEASELSSFLSSFLLNRPYILFVGQIQPRKNIIRLIDAFERIKEKNKKYPDLKLVIAGGRGWMAEKTFEKAKKSKFSKDIIFKGKVSDEDLAELYQNALMFVLPSLYEGFGLPVLEAMSYGVPCVVSDNSSLSEIVDDHALLFNANSSDDIAEKISMFLTHDHLRKDFAQRSLENIKKFTWDKAAKETLELFK